MADQGNEGILSPFLRNRRVKAVLPYLHGNVLDLGCGSGALASFIPSDLYTGVDQDELSLSVARRRYPKHMFYSSLLGENQSYDTIVSLAVIEHIKDPAAFMHDLTSRLSASLESRIILTTPHPSTALIHAMGAMIGLFSRHARDEHETLLDCSSLKALANDIGLQLKVYRRFLLGANQLAVFCRQSERL